jgi:hypothetical protein
VRLDRDLARRLRVHARAWEVPLSLIVALAADFYLQDIAQRVNQSPVRIRFRHRRGPLARLERLASDEVVLGLRRRGGRRLR